MAKGRKIIKVITIITLVITLLLVLYIMFNGLGLQDSLDFGAGAYYYADIPDFERFSEKEHFLTSIPYWIYVVLFLLWGGLMFMLWKWVDSRPK